MRNLYKENTANYPRLSTDKFFIDYENSYSFKEITDKTARFVEEIQLLDSDIWELFVEQYQVHPDGADPLQLPAGLILFRLCGHKNRAWGNQNRFPRVFAKNTEVLSCFQKRTRQEPQGSRLVFQSSFFSF